MYFPELWKEGGNAKGREEEDRLSTCIEEGAVELWKGASLSQWSCGRKGGMPRELREGKGIRKTEAAVAAALAPEN